MAAELPSEARKRDEALREASRLRLRVDALEADPAKLRRAERAAEQRVADVEREAESAMRAALGAIEEERRLRLDETDEAEKRVAATRNEARSQLEELQSQLELERSRRREAAQAALAAEALQRAAAEEDARRRVQLENAARLERVARRDLQEERELMRMLLGDKGGGGSGKGGGGAKGDGGVKGSGKASPAPTGKRSPSLGPPSCLSRESISPSRLSSLAPPLLPPSKSYQRVGGGFIYKDDPRDPWIFQTREDLVNDEEDESMDEEAASRRELRQLRQLGEAASSQGDAAGGVEAGRGFEGGHAPPSPCYREGPRSACECEDPKSAPTLRRDRPEMPVTASDSEAARALASWRGADLGADPGPSDAFADAGASGANAAGLPVPSCLDESLSWDELIGREMSMTEFDNQKVANFDGEGWKGGAARLALHLGAPEKESGQQV